MSDLDINLYELETRIDVKMNDLDKRLSLLEQKLDIIANNHLEHLKKDVDKLTAILYTAVGTLIANLIAVIFLLTK